MREKFCLEFIIQSSTSILYNYISTSFGLSEWFAENVKSFGKKFIITWNKENEEIAFLIKKKSESFVRFKWEKDIDTIYFFEMNIKKDEITGDVSLFIIDFSEPDQMDESILFWKSQIRFLQNIIR